MEGQEIKALRRRLGWTQTDLADHLHVTVNAVSKWERGDSNPDPYRAAAVEQLIRRLDEADAEQRRQEFLRGLGRAALAFGVGGLLAYLFDEATKDR